MIFLPGRVFELADNNNGLANASIERDDCDASEFRNAEQNSACIDTSARFHALQQETEPAALLRRSFCDEEA